MSWAILNWVVKHIKQCMYAPKWHWNWQAEPSQQPTTHPYCACRSSWRINYVNHLGLAWNVQTMIFLVSSRYNCIWKQIDNIPRFYSLYSLASHFRSHHDGWWPRPLTIVSGSGQRRRLIGSVVSSASGVLTVPWTHYISSNYLFLLTPGLPTVRVKTQLQSIESPWKTEWATILSQNRTLTSRHCRKNMSYKILIAIYFHIWKINLSFEELGPVAVFHLKLSINGGKRVTVPSPNIVHSSDGWKYGTQSLLSVILSFNSVKWRQN